MVVTVRQQHPDSHPRRPRIHRENCTELDLAELNRAEVAFLRATTTQDCQFRESR
jgi:hypothetical protein